MRGVWTALVSPFDSASQLDLKAFRRLVREQKAAGVNGVIPCGTTGESPTLSVAERKSLILAAVEELRDSPVRVLAGTGTNNTAETIELSKWAADQGVVGVLLVTPYYNRPSQAGLEDHFLSVAAAISVEVMLYNVPGRTGVHLLPETVARLGAHPKIRAIKEASGSVTNTSEILDLVSDAKRPIAVLCGDDALFLPSLSVGARGIVSVASNVVPRRMVALQKAFDGGDWVSAGRIHRELYPVFRDLFVESNPGPVKAALAHLGLCDARMRPPMAPLGATSLRKLMETLEKCGIRKGAEL